MATSESIVKAENLDEVVHGVESIGTIVNKLGGLEFEFQSYYSGDMGKSGGYMRESWLVKDFAGRIVMRIFDRELYTAFASLANAVER